MGAKQLPVTLIKLLYKLCIFFNLVYTDADKPLLRSLANVLKVSGCEVADWIF